MFDVKFKSSVALILPLAALSLAQTMHPTGPATHPASPPAATSPATPDPHLPAAGFNPNDSDPKAIELADQTMQAMGGREAWDNARFLTWKHYGNRRHLWDKQTGNIRFEFGDERSAAMNIILMNINTKAGRAWMGGEEIKDATQLAPYLNMGFNAWQNDSNAIFLPYLLKGTGVTLKYMGAGKMQDGRDAERIAVTYRASADGMTGKMYELYIGKDDHLVGQVDYYREEHDPSPSMTTPWKNWMRFGSIMLSDTRGKQGGKPMKHVDIAVLKSVPVSTFTSPDPVNWTALLESAGKND